MDCLDYLTTIQNESASLVWWKPEQLKRGEHLGNNPTKGERPWIIPETTGRFLYETVIQNNARHVLELGTSIAYSTLWIACALEKTKGHITTIERSHNKIPVAQKNIAGSGLSERVTLIHGQIFDVVKNLPVSEKFDTVFMDADRGHYHEYLPILKKHLTPDAVIIADNAGNMHSRMKPFLDLLTQEQWTWEIITIDNGILVATQKHP